MRDLISAVAGVATLFVPVAATAAVGPVHLTCGDTQPNEHGSYYYFEVVVNEDLSEVVFDIRSNGCCAKPEKVTAVITPDEVRFETGSLMRYENKLSRIDLSLTRKTRDGSPIVEKCVISQATVDRERAF